MRSFAILLVATSAQAADLTLASLAPYARKGLPGQYLAALERVDKSALQAARLFDELRPRYALLDNYCLYHAARAYYRAGRFDLSVARASRVAHDSTLDADARLLLADALSAARRADEARRSWREYLERYPKGMRLAEVYYRLGEYGHAYALGTLGPWEERTKSRVKLDTLTAEDHVARGLILANAQRHEEAFSAFARALKGKPNPAVECEARFEQAETVWRQRDRTRADPLYAQAATVCHAAGDVDRRVRALYQQGRCLVNIGKPEAAAAVYVQAQDRNHSYGDDARLREAEAWEEAGKPEQAAALLTTLPDLFPNGDMRQEAIWRLARMAYFDGRYREALATLERSSGMGRETDYFAEGRSHYWRARLLTKLGRPSEARQSYESAIREYPLSYYALWAFQRLRKEFPAAAVALEKKLISVIPAHPKALTFADCPLFRSEGFRRGVELWRLGQRASARREWTAIGVKDKGEHEKLLWIVAALLDAEGNWPESHNLPRRVLSDYRTRWPHGPHATRWHIAFPNGYATLIEREARRAGIPAALFFAIVREESGFDAQTVSYAHAYGLTQMIMPTAKRFSSQPKRVNAKRLLDPAFNVPIGARFLAFEYTRFKKAAPLAVAAYNAGEGAVDKWLRQRGSLDLDEFVELIPYDQTRRYTKRVLSSYFTYAALYGAPGTRIPTLPLAR